MDLPGPAALKQLHLSVSAEGRGFAYYVSDLTNGKILSISRAAAKAFMLFEDVVGGNPKSREKLSDDQAREGLGVVSYLRSVRDQERLQTTKVNPMSMQFKFFDVGQFQPALQPLANWLIGWPILLLFATLAVLAFVIGTSNNWAIWVEFQGIFNLEALLTFGLIAPFLKVIHEFGHVLVATKFNVRVRQAGMNLIGLYPLPFVDCTEADLTARRRDRIWISLAGLFTDFLIGLIAFMVWHLAESDAVQSVAGRVLAFSTVSSILFNANPLMKFDGYYAFVDMIGQRNLYSRANKSFKGFRQYVGSFGATGQLPQQTEGWSVLGYGIATFLYRIFILYTIMATLMPQYLGLGMVIAVWGGYAMFLSPMIADRRPQPKTKAARPLRTWFSRFLFFGLFAVIIIFVKLPFVRVIPLELDKVGFYAVSAQSDGVVADALFSAGPVQEGQLLFAQSNPRYLQEQALLALEEDEAEILVANTAGVSAAQSRAAIDKRASVQDRQAALERSIANLRVTAADTGVFVPLYDEIRRGRFVSSGATIGALYPDTGSARLIGAFPERLVETYQTSATQIEFWDEHNYVALSSDAVRLVEAVNIDATSGVRSFQLQAVVANAPSDLIGRDAQLKLDFGARPIWEHIRFWIDGQIAAFRDAQLSDQARRVGNQ